MIKQKRKRKNYNYPYKSKLEKRIAEVLEPRGFKYESKKIKFTQPAKHRTYTPDFTNEDIHIEVKGRISDLDELLKVVWCREQYPGRAFIWVIQNPNGRAYPQTSQTLGDWLTKKGFKWYKASDIIDGEEIKL